MNFKEHRTENLSWPFLKELRRRLYGRRNNMKAFLKNHPTLDSAIKMIDEMIVAWGDAVYKTKEGEILSCSHEEFTRKYSCD